MQAADASGEAGGGVVDVFVVREVFGDMQTEMSSQFGSVAVVVVVAVVQIPMREHNAGIAAAIER